ncbi:MAG TPA: helix-turn-helix transcriptional regulator [Terrimicrobiaceae bacterium]|nr:helix-turn-helix transcriptional regulator [Terrimicrobiaceae bacterium]
MPGVLDKKLADFLRKERGDLSYAAFARKLGLSKTTTYNLENLWRSPSLQTVEDICRKLRVSPADIFGEDTFRKRG